MQTIIAAYGAWGVFLSTMLEEIVAPIPSPIVPLAAGFFLLPSDAGFISTVLHDAFSIALPVATGVTIGSAAVYAIGYFGGKPVIERTARWTGITWPEIEMAEKRITQGRGDEWALLGLRILPIVPGVAISGFCGLVRYPFSTFIIITPIGSFIRAFGLGLLGWQVGELYEVYAHAIAKFEKYLLALALLAFVGAATWYLYRRFKGSTPEM